MSILSLRDVRYTYKSQYQSNEAVKGITYDFEQGKTYAIMGRSGSGKTTLLSMMAGLDLPTSGDVLYEGKSTSQMDLEQYRREHAAVIYQNFRLFPLLTAAENVMFPMELRKMKAREAKGKAAELIEKVGLPSGVLNRYPTMLSGGEQQRVAIARALSMNTRMLLADEPTGNLDSANSERIFQLLSDLAHKEGYCVIIVTHDEDLGSRCDQRIRLKDGLIVE